MAVAGSVRAQADARSEHSGREYSSYDGGGIGTLATPRLTDS
jgi:hypothetical protein